MFRVDIKSIGVVFALVLAAALFGTLTRPIGFLSSFWPANAILLAAMLMSPQRAAFLTWLSAILAFVVADMLTGGDLETTLWLTAGNVAGAFCGWLVMRGAAAEMRRLDRPEAIWWMLRGAVVAAVGAAIAGSGVGPRLLGTDPGTALAFWFATELVNYIVILPLALTMPTLLADRRRLADIKMWRIWPAVSLAVSMLAAALVGGPGAIAIPMPALVWCALTYPVAVTAILNVILCGWLMIAFAEGTMQVESALGYLHLSISVRIGTAMLALAPLTIAAINEARNELTARLRRMAATDTLTGTLSRGETLIRARATLRRAAERGVPVGLLMLDIDRFKLVNDTHGHRAGDDVLIAFSRCVQEVLRPEDSFGRLGGEEFLVVIEGADLAMARMMAERLRTAVATCRISSEGVDLPPVTVSVGVATTRESSDLEHVLLVADRALYRAKSTGRNRVEDSAAEGRDAGAPASPGTMVA